MIGSERVWRRADLALQVGLARGLSVRAAARAAGVSESTVRRRKKDPAFRAELQQRTQELAAELVKITASDLAAPRRRDAGNAIGAGQFPRTAQESRISESARVTEEQPRRDGVGAAARPKPVTVAPAAPRIGSAKREPPTVEKGDRPLWLAGAAVAGGLAGLYMMLHKIGATEYYRDHDTRR